MAPYLWRVHHTMVHTSKVIGNTKNTLCYKTKLNSDCMQCYGMNRPIENKHDEQCYDETHDIKIGCKNANSYVMLL